MSLRRIASRLRAPRDRLSAARARVGGLGRAGGVGSAWLAVAVAATLGAMVLAARLPGPRALGLEAAVGGGGGYLEAGGSPRFAPLSPAILSDLFGAGIVERLLGPVGRPHPPSGHPEPPPGPAPEPPPGDEGPLPGPQELTEAPDLRIEMSVDKAEARPGETLTYLITVTNVGHGAAKDVWVRSHVPKHTSLVAGWECDGENVSLSPNPGSPAGYSVCVSVPGPAAPGEHGFRNHIGPVRAGQQVRTMFKVAVDPNAPAGTVIRNHGHATNPDFPTVTSNTVSTRVR